MKILAFFLFGVLLGASHVLSADMLPSQSRQRHDGRPSTQSLEMMSPQLPADAILRRDSEHGTITFLKSANLSAALEQEADFRALQADKRYGAMVLMFLNEYRQLFKLQAPEQELTIASIDSDHLGFTHIRLQQQYRGIPVWGTEVVAHIDPMQHVYLVQGHYLATPEQVQTSPVLTMDDALASAAQALGRSASECPQCQAMLTIFSAHNRSPRLAYRVEASTSLTETWALMIDAIDGSVLERRAVSNPGPFLKRR